MSETELLDLWRELKRLDEMLLSVRAQVVLLTNRVDFAYREVAGKEPEPDKRGWFHEG